MEDLGHVYVGRLGEPLRILQLTDLHVFPQCCAEFMTKGRVVPLVHPNDRSFKVTESILRRVRPHLVVLTGDIIDGRPFGAAEKPDEHGWRSALLEVLGPIVAVGAAWTFIPGNHDDDSCPWSRKSLLSTYHLGTLAPGCISAKATCFNHTVSVGPAPPPHAQTVRLWLFDSGGNNLEEPANLYQTFRAEAVAGFRGLSNRVPRAGCELAYFHIPLPQCAGLYPVAGRNGLFDAALRSNYVPRPWCWQPFTAVVRLLGKDRVVGASKLESGLFHALLESARVCACFFGHDHYSDAVFLRDGIFLAYGRVGGSTPPCDWEGDGGPLPFQTGSRVVEWNSEATPKLCTWVEVEEGVESGSNLVLNATAVASSIKQIHAQKRLRLVLTVAPCCVLVLALLWHAPLTPRIGWDQQVFGYGQAGSR